LNFKSKVPKVMTLNQTITFGGLDMGCKVDV